MNLRRIPVWICLSAMAMALVPVVTSFGSAALAAERAVNRLTPAEAKQRAVRERYNFISGMGGPYRDISVRRYVAGIGRRLVEMGGTFGDYFEGMPEFKYTILNDPSAGAYVLGGGEILITRGLLAIAGTEDEVAAVLAHEIAHVIAGHSNRYGNTLEVQRAKTNVRYNMEQEFEADFISVRLLANAGYDPFAQARMLSAVSGDMAFSVLVGRSGPMSDADLSKLQAGIDERIARVRDAASSLSIDAGVVDRRATHLAAIDGMDYGQLPSRGIVYGQTFSDSLRRYSFTVPDGFTFERTTRPLRAVGPGGATIRLDSTRTRRRNLDLVRYLVRYAGRGRPLEDVVYMSVDGMSAAMGVTHVSTPDGPVEIRVVAIYASSRTIYRFQYMMPEGITPAQEDELWRTTYTFKRLSRQEAAALKPYRLALVTVEEGDTIDTLAGRMAFLDHSRTRFKLLNGIRADAPLIPGQTLKIVIR